jgi:transcriptional regulator with XRE-family HTH domain
MGFGLEELGANIKRLRQAKPSRHKSGRAMLQKELAELADIPASSLCNIERGKYPNPTWEILSKIARGLECEISDFFESETPSVSPSQIALTEMIEMIIRERVETILSEQNRR